MGLNTMSSLWETRTKSIFLLVLILMLIILCLKVVVCSRIEEDDEGRRGGGGGNIFNKKTRKLLLKLFRRRIKIPEKSSLSLATQVSRPNIAPGIFNQEDGIIIDAVVEFPMWLDLDDFADAIYNRNPDQAKSSSFIGIERCFLYEKLEWLVGAVAQLSEKTAHTCVLKFICETQSIHTFYPDYPISVVFELIHLILTPSSGADDPCFKDYVVAENKGKMYGRCDRYDAGCRLSVGGVLIHNFFPSYDRDVETRNEQDQVDNERFIQFYSMFKHLL